MEHQASPTAFAMPFQACGNGDSAAAVFLALPPSQPPGLSRRSLQRALSYMEQHLGEPIGLDDIATAACLSRAHFARMFRVSTGQSVMAYLTRLRIERAKQRLVDDDPRLADLSGALGFCDQSHFCRVFRRSTGTTPKRYAHHHGQLAAGAG